MNRFGLGASATQAKAEAGRAWLTGQIAAYDPWPAALASVTSSAAILRDVGEFQSVYRDIRQQKRAASAGNAQSVDEAAMLMRRDARGVLRRHYSDAVDARIVSALTTPTPFAERLAHFWANHFAISADKVTVIPLAGAFEFEAIRPHVMGRFVDLLKAAETHPAMLLYLDQTRSLGPNSPIGQRQAGAGKQRGLNENLAREILELHTLGARSGYTQADVTELARALTGWTVPIRGIDDTDGAAFQPQRHEPGGRTLLGKRYAQADAAQLDAILADLAVHPATARHLATKLTVHFAGDAPPPAMVARLEAAFIASNGDLPTVYRAIIASPEAWVAQPIKFRTPWEWSIAAMRALGTTTIAPGSGNGLQTQLGQQVWKPGQPNGYDDVAVTWAGADALMRRVEAAERLAQRAGPVDARALGQSLFPEALTAPTAAALQRADSPGQALALLLVAPEMLRR
ncbi:DUF1800 domain-containing protein [Sphingomonas sp. NBWT7]|nr:DUF1800 domain-containing protein [Sphingomonas sp. NBWT7]